MGITRGVVVGGVNVGAGVGAQETKRKTVNKKGNFGFISSDGVSQLAGELREHTLTVTRAPRLHTIYFRYGRHLQSLPA